MSDSRWRRIVDSTSEPALAIDEGEVIVAWNGAMEELLGVAARDALGRPCRDVLCGLDVFGNLYCRQDCNMLRMVRRSEAMRRFHLDVRRADGERIRSEVFTLVVPGARNGHFAVVHLLRPLPGGAREEKGEAPSPEPGPAAAGGSETILLTDREQEILRLLATGAGTREIAESLGISPATVRNHVQNLLRKLDVHSKLEAVALAFRRGLV